MTPPHGTGTSTHGTGASPRGTGTSSRGTGTSPRRRVLAAAALSAAVLLAGCGSSDPAPAGHAAGADSSLPTAGPPLPAGAAMITRPTPPPSAPQDCAADGSLRPDPDGTAPAAPGTPQPPRLHDIRERGRIIVGLDQGSNLFSFRDPLSGDLVGFDVGIAHEIARGLLGDPDLVEFRFLTSAERERALEEGTVDMVVKTMTITCERARHVAFSTVYYDAHQRILVPRDSPVTGPDDLAGRTVCAAAGTTSIPSLWSVAPDARIMTVPSWGDCLVALQQRQVDAVSTDDTILAGMTAQDPNLHIVGPPIADEPYGIGMPKGADALVRAVNAVLEDIREDGTWTRLYDRWLTVLGPAPAPPAPTYAH